MIVHGGVKMAITPEDIQNKSFSVRMRGYDQKEVNLFLDEIYTELAKQNQLNDELNSKVSNLSERLKDYEEKHESLNRSIMVAQDAADRVKSEAELKAQELVDKANKDGDQVLNEARKNADELLIDAVHKVRTINKEIDDLKKHSQLFRQKLSYLIQSQEKIVNHEDWEEILAIDPSGEVKLDEVESTVTELNQREITTPALEPSVVDKYKNTGAATSKTENHSNEQDRSN